MPPRVQREYFVTIKDQDHWNSLVSPDSKKLTVVDVHLNWCGPCSLMSDIYRTIAMKINDWEDRI